MTHTPAPAGRAPRRHFKDRLLENAVKFCELYVLQSLTNYAGWLRQSDVEIPLVPKSVGEQLLRASEKERNKILQRMYQPFTIPLVATDGILGATKRRLGIRVIG
jgi:hypothetical protein